MSILGIGRDEFENFKSDINSRLSSLSNQSLGRFSELEGAIQHKVTDSEEEARVAASNSRDLEAQVRELVASIASTLSEVDSYKVLAGEEVSQVVEIRNKINVDGEFLAKSIVELRSQYESITQQKVAVDAAIAESYEKLSALEKVVARQDSLVAQVDGIGELSVKAAALHKDLTVLQENALKRRGAIEDIYFEIFGRDVKAEDGTVQREEGLRELLDNAYGELQERAESIGISVEEMLKTVLDDYSERLGEQKEIFDKLIGDSALRVKTVDDELTALLPGSMAAGLSAAYEKKADDEIVAQSKYAKSFGWAIFAMIAISGIPFAVDAYLLVGRGMDIVQVIKGTPNLIFSIFPLYFPVLWFAYSSNKKLNLSKRLIEEYTHKAVLGKTFSGLSTQIESLPRETAAREELRTRLLFNLLQVSSENPGKLITDYNKTDHPFMEALEKSAKLSEAVESLSKLPGFSAMAEKLASSNKRIIAEQAQKVEQGLAIQGVLDSNSDSDDQPKA